MQLSDKYPFLAEYFTSIVNSSKNPVPQSIVFYGNDFQAQYTLAKEFARLLNCKNDKSDDCECLNCKWINENNHPAVITISRIDNKPDDDESKTVISVKQSAMIKEQLINDSEFNRVYILCDRDADNNIRGLNKLNFQADTANSMLKIIEEPQPGVTFIFLTRYIDDLLPTIISRSQCFFVPSFAQISYDYSLVKDNFENYWNFNRKDVFDISQNLVNLSTSHGVNKILDSMQNYILYTLKLNPKNNILIQHIKDIEEAKKTSKLRDSPS